jgi:hypothetical protein
MLRVTTSWKVAPVAVSGPARGILRNACACNIGIVPIGHAI